MIQCHGYDIIEDNNLLNNIKHEKFKFVSYMLLNLVQKIDILIIMKIAYMIL